MTLAQALEQSLLAQTSDLLPEARPGEVVLPWYAGRSLANAPAALAQALGLTLPGAVAPLERPYLEPLGEGLTQLICVLVDALGYRQLQRQLVQRPGSVWERLARDGALLPFTSVFPSTTATALASLLTGVEPLAHGLLGYELWLREHGVLAQMLQLKPALGPDQASLLDWGFRPEAFIPAPGLGTALSAQDVTTVAVNYQEYQHSALSRMLYRGFDRLVGYRDVAEMWRRTAQQVASRPTHKRLILVYWGNIDAAIHTHGSADGVWETQFDSLTRAFEEHLLNALTAQQRQRTGLVLCADHGWVDAPVEAAHDTETDPVLTEELLIPYSGEARAAYLHLRRGPCPEALAALRAALGDGYHVVEMERAVAAGLFGRARPAPESLARLGHALAIARGQRYLDRLGKRFKIRGRHGGLSPQEMLIPWLAVRLDA